MDKSLGDADSKPLTERNETALSVGVGDGKLTVMVPLDSACLTGAEKTRVRMFPALVTSASLVYVLLAVSLTVTFEAVASMATVTMIVFIWLGLLPTETLPVCVSEVAPLSSVWVPIVAGVIAPGTVRTRVPEGTEVYPRESVAVAVILCVPGEVSALVVMPGLAY